MIVQSFRSVMWVGAVAGAALCCYMVSLRVASERAALEGVETRILLAKRDIRALDTEIATRGRLRQLERWNVDVLALSAPNEGQFLTGEYQLASLTGGQASEPADAPAMYAVAPKPEAPEAKPILASFKPKVAKSQNRARLFTASMSTDAPRAVKPAAKAKVATKDKPAAAKQKLAAITKSPADKKVKAKKAL